MIEIQFERYQDINCKTNFRVTECIGYKTSLCTGQCNYARVYDRFHSAASGIERFKRRLDKTMKIKGKKEMPLDEMFIGGTG